MAGAKPNFSTNDDLVIQGILKETLVTESPFEIQPFLGTFKLIDVTEDTIRGKSQQKLLSFKVPDHFDGSSNLQQNRFYSFSVGFYRNRVSFESRFVEIKDNTLIFSLPELLFVVNVRKNGRSVVKSELRKANPLLLRTEGLHCEGIFIIDNTSEASVGGILHVPKGFPISASTSVTGEIVAKQHEISIKGSIVRAHKTKDEKEGYDSYSVGIQQSLKTFTVGDLSSNNRRKHKRYKVATQIRLTPLIFPDFHFQITLKDISVVGFSGTSIPGSVLPCLPIGTVFSIENMQTKVQLVHFADEVMHFNIVSRTEKDCIQWLRIMTPVLNEGTKCNLSEARDLYRVFLQAGAISTKYLKRHSFYNEALLANPELFDSESGYLHRWYVAGSDGQVQAHISAIRFSDNCWFLGDIAKVSKSDVNGESLTKIFFSSFAEFCETLSPSPCLMGMWLDGHPLWKNWQTRITNQPDVVVADVFFDYYRISQDVIKSSMGPVTREIAPTELSTIKAILAKLDVRGTGSFVRSALDFDYNVFGSPRLKACTQTFFRRYFLIETDGDSHLAVLSKYPRGTSFNRIADAVFLFPINQTKHESTSRNLAVEQSYRLSLQLGLEIPSVRYVFSDPKESSDSEKLMRCFVLTPAGFHLFERFR